MPISRTRVRASYLAGVSLAIALLTGTAALPARAQSATPPPPPSATDSTPDPALSARSGEVDPDAVAAMAKDRGISLAEATRRLAGQKTLAARGAAIEKALAGRTGGFYLDSGGQLVVTTVDATGEAAARGGGARTQRVDDTTARLAGIMRKLDQEASSKGAGSVQGWYVDVPSNSVVVTVTEGAADARTVALTALAASFGSSVRFEHRPSEQAPRPAEWMVGGYEFLMADGGSCSVGFNTRDSAGRNVVLTAGHCVKAGGTMTRNGYAIGAARTANYPGQDYGTFWNYYPTYWQPSPSVYKYDGTYVTIRGRWDSPPVGATICKSGRTTGYTCGYIRALNQTVIYKVNSATVTVNGLVRHNACVEPGDSGGSNVSFYSGYAYAVGITSGASTDEQNHRCLGAYGQENVSWYQPIGPALSANGLSLLYQP